MSRAWRAEWASFAGLFIVTNLGLLAVGATLAVLPHYVKDNLNGSDLEVGVVTGAFAFTGIVCRPIAGNIADRRGRKPTVVVGCLLAATAGFLYFVPAGIFGGHRVHCRVGLERRHGAGGDARSHDRPLWPGDLDGPDPRTSHRRPAAACGGL